MSRKRFVVTPTLRSKVHSLAAVGTRQDDIARMIGCSAKTLRNNFRVELDNAMAEANAAIAGYLFENAKNGNVAAQIFWLKTRAKWKSSPSNGDPDFDHDNDPPPPPRKGVIIIPDNGRDPEMLKRYLQRDHEFEIERYKWAMRQKKK